MRVCIIKATGKLIEAQSGGKAPPVDPKWTPAEIETATVKYREANLKTLIDNALAAGYKADDIEAKFVDDIEFAEILEASKSPEQKTAEVNAPVVSRLSEIDLKSIRSLREWLVAQPDAPQFIIDLEATAMAERKKLKK
jgi:hypothetical protein